MFGITIECLNCCKIQQIILYTTVISVSFNIHLTCGKNESNRRVQRFLHFPNKTNFVVTISLIKLLPTETIVQTLTELDAFFPVSTSFSHGTKIRMKRQAMYDQLTTIANGLGFEEDFSTKKSFRQIRKYIHSTDRSEQENLLLDILRIIFK